jgi:purine-nucleoside phosphorylase
MAVHGGGGARQQAGAGARGPHRYEGWRDEDLERPLRDLAAAGVRRFMLVNACGGLGSVRAGQTVVCEAVIDLQRPPRGPHPERLPVCSPAQAASTASLLSARLSCSPGAPGSVPGIYVALAGPQFETPAEARWLSRYGDVVGMSAAPEVRAAAACGAECMLIGVVANAAGGADTHAAVLEAASDCSRRLAAALIPAAAARWPELAGPEEA